MVPQVCVCVYPLQSQGSRWIVSCLLFEFFELEAGGRVTADTARPTKRVPVGADAVGDARLCTCKFVMFCNHNPSQSPSRILEVASG